MKKTFLIAAVSSLILSSCNKEAGEGGNSSISGKISKDVRVVLNNPSTRTGTYPAADQDVYIIYGDQVSPGDKIETNYDGEYEFRFLRPGNYKIYTFSRDTNAVAVAWDEEHMTILREVEIADKKQDVTVEEMKIYDTE